MKRLVAALMVVILLFTVAIPKQEAYADPITITALSAAAYTMAQAAGLSWAFTAGTAANAQTYMEDILSKWTSNNGGISIFGTTPVKAIAGKLAIAQQAYNALKDFINDYITDNTITTTPKQVCAGFNGGTQLYSWLEFGGNAEGFHCDYEFPTNANTSPLIPGFTNSHVTFTFGIGDSTATYTFTRGDWIKPIYWRVFYLNNNQWQFQVLNLRHGNEYDQEQNLELPIGVIRKEVSTPTTSVINASIQQDGMIYETVLTGEQWEADVGAAPDTNIEQLIPEVFTDVANNDLVISDEEVTTDTPATPAPTSVPDTNLGQLIGSIDSTVTDISDALEGVGEQVGTISETLEGVGAGVGAISDALAVPSTAEAQSLKLPDMRTLFPFCIPFDVYNIITAFNVTPQAPHVQIPFNVPVVGLQYTFDLDFSAYNGVAAILRTLEFVAFAVGLAILTSKVIRW